MAIPPPQIQYETTESATIHVPRFTTSGTNLHMILSDLTHARCGMRRIPLWWRWVNPSPPPQEATEPLATGNPPPVGGYNPEIIVYVYFDELRPNCTYTFMIGRCTYRLTAAADCHGGRRLLKRKAGAWFVRGPKRFVTDQAHLDAIADAWEAEHGPPELHSDHRDGPSLRAAR